MDIQESVIIDIAMPPRPPRHNPELSRYCLGGSDIRYYVPSSTSGSEHYASTAPSSSTHPSSSTYPSSQFETQDHSQYRGQSAVLPPPIGIPRRVRMHRYLDYPVEISEEDGLPISQPPLTFSNNYSNNCLCDTRSVQREVRAVGARLHEEIKDCHSAMSPTKKVLLGLGLAFLSASTVRYWMDKAEPLLESYRQSPAVVRNIPQRFVPAQDGGAQSPRLREVDALLRPVGAP